MADPLWKLRSGQFAGWRVGDLLYDAAGHNVGYFVGDVAYSTRGTCVGELYNRDTIGKRLGIAHPRYGARARVASIAVGRLAHRSASPLGGWDDPDF